MRYHSSPRMTLFVDGFKSAVFHMGVDLCGANAGVSEHFLKCPDVSSTSKQMGGEAVAQRVRAHVFGTSDPRSVALNQSPDCFAVNGATASCQK